MPPIRVRQPAPQRARKGVGVSRRYQQSRRSAVGIGAGEITWVEAFAGWSLARALQLIPLTPGGVGPVELGMTGVLVGFGGANAEVVAAVLVFRFLTIVPTLVLGLAAAGTLRRQGVKE